MRHDNYLFILKWSKLRYIAFVIYKCNILMISLLPNYNFLHSNWWKHIFKLFFGLYTEKYNVLTFMQL